MKKIYYKIPILLLLIFIGVSCGTSRPVSTEQQIAALRQHIDSGEYKIEATMAFPRGGRSVPLTSVYSLEIKNDSVYSHLPFYGRAYSIPYGGGDGLNFAVPVQDYRVEYKSNGSAVVRFSARTPEDLFKFALDIFPNGTTNIDVTMQQRQSMRYTGNINFPD